MKKLDLFFEVGWMGIMIIAAHAGTGKTRFAKTVYDSVDFVCMPYKYNLPDGILSYEETEGKKADINLQLRDEWPENYIKAVVNQYNENRYVIIPPIVPVLNALRKEKIPYILCYPERNAKDEYERRYKERGNTTDFLNVFIGYWDIFLDQMEADQGEYHFVMKRSEFLTDLYPRFEKITRAEESTISFELDEDALDKANAIYQKTGYTIQTLFRREMIRIDESGEIPAYMKKDGFS